MKFRNAPYADLADGGRHLAAELRDVPKDAVLVAICPGGAVVGRVVADELGLPLLALTIEGGQASVVGATPQQLAGKAIVLIDDGVESGTAARIAIAAARAWQPAHLTFAVPICHAQAAAELGALVDKLVAPRRPFTPRALRWEYVTFEPPADNESAVTLAQPLGL